MHTDYFADNKDIHLAKHHYSLTSCIFKNPLNSETAHSTYKHKDQIMKKAMY